MYTGPCRLQIEQDIRRSGPGQSCQGAQPSWAHPDVPPEPPRELESMMTAAILSV